MNNVHQRLPKPTQLGRFAPGKAKPMMAMLEITERCNLACPVCFARATHRGSDISVDQARRYLTQLLEITETPVPIQISGGEPTLHPELPAIIAAAKHLGYRHIELITNGVRISQDPRMLLTLKEAGLKAVYLQFDGLRKETLRRIRGADMTGVRRSAIDAIRRAALCCTLAVAVVRGVNDHEIGDIIRFGIDHMDVVRAINFQAATAFEGRFDIAASGNGLDTQQITHLIEAQSGVPADSFISEAIGHRRCNAMSMVFIVDGRLMPLFGYIDASDIRRFLGAQPRQKILDAFEGKKAFYFRHLVDPNTWRLLAKAAPIFGRRPANVLGSRHLLLFAKGFMNKNDLDEERLDSCCYAITGRRGVFSFCAYNNIHRFAEDHRQPAIGKD